MASPGQRELMNGFVCVCVCVLFKSCCSRSGWVIGSVTPIHVWFSTRSSSLTNLSEHSKLNSTKRIKCPVLWYHSCRPPWHCGLGSLCERRTTMRISFVHVRPSCSDNLRVCGMKHSILEQMENTVFTEARQRVLPARGVTLSSDKDECSCCLHAVTRKTFDRKEFCT